MSEVPSFDQVHNQIGQQLAEQAAQKVFAELRSKAKIKRFAPDGQPLPDAEQK
jgi:hypothetical protein